MDSWRAPQRIGNDHLADEFAYLRRDLWSSTGASRFPSPEAAKSRSMPPDHRFRPNDGKRVHHTRNEAIEGDKDQSVDAGKNESLWRLATNNIELVTKDKNLSLKRRFGSDQGA